jgi:uncharacterized phage-associated protein
MKTIDEISEIKATILYILKSFPEGIDYIKLFKIMYFAQQNHILKYAKPIFNDTFHAFKHGPVPSFSYKCFKMLEGDSIIPVKDDLKIFTDAFSISKEPQLICRKEDPNMDYLSVSNIKSIDQTIEKYGKMKSNELSKLSHDKAWHKAAKRARKDPDDDRITIIDIAIAGGADEKFIHYLREIQFIKKYFSL